MKFIIEHLTDKLYEWCLIEYTHISKVIGKKNLIFTNVKNSKERRILEKLGEVKKESVLDLNLSKICLLDPKASKTLEPNDSFKFDYFLFGGILGDYPEQGRTEKYLTSKIKNAEIRNLLDKQMSTDTAVLVSKLILDGKKISEIKFIDSPSLIMKRGRIQEEVNLPYRYINIKDKPLMSKKLITYLKNKKDL